MVDNSEDKGYVEVLLKETENGPELCKKIFLFEKDPGEKSFYVNFENGTIFISYAGDDEKTIIGTYDTTPGHLIDVRVYDYPTKCLIGRITDGCISFNRNGVDYGAIKGIPDEVCLAWYTQAGRIETTDFRRENVGYIIGNVIGGAAAFIAIFYNFRIISIFRDFYCMDKNAFDEKYASYLHPFG